ncbi:hypothetical protein LOK49_LG01G02974 [Camellia lanceoleosa]|uniref:Uncharacterized protein n=1 Tax=Camellia lanceoleosa TaxID=1840588 RepID=A0ACC0J3L5_9ERIC|nr:hypothetical protein LOK49_LG01G02974 [Camellia lanceoleosa]
MDAFHFDNVKAEKAKAMLRYNRLRTIAKLFRLLEIFLALLLLSWISARFPFAIKISGEYFRRLIAIVVSPLFIFIISNVIVITLLAKSGQLSGKTLAINSAETDLYDELIKNIGNEINYGPENCPPVPESKEIVYEEKQIVSELIAVTPKSNELIAETVSCAKVLRRSQSEMLKRENSKKNCGKLRRSETEKCRRVEDSGEVPPETVNLSEELSNEEFNRTVEEFIAKQVKFHQEEKLAIVTC